MEPFRLSAADWSRIAGAMRAGGLDPGEPDRRGVEGLLWAARAMQAQPGRGRRQPKEAVRAFRRVQAAAADLAAALVEAGAVQGGADAGAMEALGADGAAALPDRLPALAAVAAMLAQEAEGESVEAPRADPAGQWLDVALWRLWRARVGDPAPVGAAAVAFFDAALRAAGRDMGAAASGAKRAAQRAKERAGDF
jgi:hypothetical protein